MVESQHDFLGRRVREEREAAIAASDSCAAQVHVELAIEYGRRLRALHERDAPKLRIVLDD